MSTRPSATRPVFQRDIRRGNVRLAQGVTATPTPVLRQVAAITDNVLLNGALYLATTTYAGGLAIVSAANDNRVTVVDISDPLDPTVIGSVQHATELFTPQGITIVGTHAFIAIPGAVSRFTSVDFSTPSSPFIADSIQDSAAFSNALFPDVFDANHIIVAGNEIALVNVADPTNMSVVRIYEPGAESQGGVVAYLGQYAIMTRPTADVVRVVDMTTNPPFVAATLVLADEPTDIVLRDDLVFIGLDTTDAIAIVDVSTPTAPEIVTIYAGIDGDQLALYGEYLLATDAGSFLYALDAHTTTMTEYASTFYDGGIDDMSVLGDFVYWVDNSDRFVVGEIQNFAP